LPARIREPPNINWKGDAFWNCAQGRECHSIDTYRIGRQPFLRLVVTRPGMRSRSIWKTCNSRLRKFLGHPAPRQAQSPPASVHLVT
jgi:hypothetical protein